MINGGTSKVTEMKLSWFPKERSFQRCADRNLLSLVSLLVSIVVEESDLVLSTES